MKYLFTIMIAGSFLIGCSNSAKNGMAISSKKTTKEPLIEAQGGEFALENMLRKTAGVNIQGSGSNAYVQIRGMNSINSNTQPLFIINGNTIGNSYNTAAGIVRGMQIKSIRVLKDSDASFYGVRGAGGVILIRAE